MKAEEASLSPCGRKVVIDGLEEGAGDADRELLGELLQTTVIHVCTWSQGFPRAVTAGRTEVEFAFQDKAGQRRMYKVDSSRERTTALKAPSRA